MRANQVQSVHRDPRHNVEINVGKICNKAMASVIRSRIVFPC